METSSWFCFRDGHLSIGEGQFLDILGTEDNLIVDVDGFLLCFEPQLCVVQTTIVAVSDDDSHGTKPGDLFSACVWDKLGVHDELFVVDEVEGKTLFTLDSVAKHLSRGKIDTEVRIVSSSSDLIVDDGD